MSCCKRSPFPCIMTVILSIVLLNVEVVLSVTDQSKNPTAFTHNVKPIDHVEEFSSNNIDNFFLVENEPP